MADVRDRMEEKRDVNVVHSAYTRCQYFRSYDTPLPHYRVARGPIAMTSNSRAGQRDAKLGGTIVTVRGS